MNEPAYNPSDRRPIQSRNTRWASWTAELLANKGISPNAISIFGMLAAILAGALFFSTSMTSGTIQRLAWLCGGLLCQLRLLCNLFDGMVAIKRNVASAKGELYNEVPDRVSDAAVLIGLGYAAGGDVALGYLAAIIAVFVAYVRAMAKSLGCPNDFCGPMAKPQRMALATILAAYMVIAPANWKLPWGEARLILAVIVVAGIVTAIRRLGRAKRHLEGNAE